MQKNTTCTCAGACSSRQAPSSRGEHTTCVGLRLTPWVSHKLDRPAGGPWRLPLQRPTASASSSWQALPTNRDEHACRVHLQPAPRSFKLAPSVESPWRLPLQKQVVHGPHGTHSPQAETSTHIASAFALHRGAAASLLDQSELHGGFRCKSKPPAPVQVHGPHGKHSPQAETSKHLEPNGNRTA